MLPTIRQLLREASLALSEHGIDHPQLEAEVLLAFVLQVSRTSIIAWPEKRPDESQYDFFKKSLYRRCAYEPLAYITGKREFWSIELDVTPATLIPRPETELLVETTLSLGDGMHRQIKLADLGTGSGAIALAVAKERPAWSISAVDIHPDTLDVAKKNAVNLQLQHIHFYCGHWCVPLEERGFDIIVSNPPYISEAEWSDYEQGLRFEPRAALVSGSDGLDAIREISAQAGDFLASGGFLLIEHGFRQSELVRDILLAKGYTNVHSLSDLSGHQRLTVAMRR